MNKDERSKLIEASGIGHAESYTDEELLLIAIQAMEVLQTSIVISDNLQQVLQDWVFSGSGIDMSGLDDEQYCQHVIDKITAPPPVLIGSNQRSMLDGNMSEDDEALALAERYITDSSVQLSKSHMEEVVISGEKKRQYHPYKEPATKSDIMSARMDADKLIIVLSDGQKLTIGF